MRKFFQFLNIIVLTLALSYMNVMVAGTSSRIAAGTTSPSCTINQVGQTNPHPGCLKQPNVGWNSR